jgi:hypothetical protein
MVKGSVKYQDLLDQGLIITPKSDYEKAQVDMQILAFENQKYRYALEKIANDSDLSNNTADRYRQIARWGLWNFSNVTGKTYKTLDPSIAERANAAFIGQETVESVDVSVCQNDQSSSSDGSCGATDF